MTGTVAMRAVALAVVVVGCGGGAGKSTADSVASAAGTGVAPPPASADAANATSGTECVSAGAWQACSVEKRLTDAGFVPVKQDAPAADLFAVQGVEYVLGAARLHVYVFPTADDRAAAVAAIDTVAVTRRGTPAPWGGPAWLITSNNLVAVLVSDNARLVERVQLALTAGLPRASN